MSSKYDILAKHTIVTLCGSTKFKEDFLRIQKELVLKGFVVLLPDIFSHSDDPDLAKDESLCEMFDSVHKQKIRMAREILIIDKGGYIGESTKKEIDYARSLGKPVFFMSNAI